MDINGRLRKLYKDIESSLDREEVDTIKLLLSDIQLPKCEKDRLTRAAAIFVRLEERGLIKPDDLKLLHIILTQINRTQLIATFITPCERDIVEILGRLKENRLAEGASSSVHREEEFANMLFNLVKEIREDELISLKNLCGNVYELIPQGDLEKKKQAFEVFQYLRQISKISSYKTELLVRLLDQIHRNDLVEKFVKIYGS
ncbi:caspase-8-like [Saccoglossus kowalevskii]